MSTRTPVYIGPRTVQRPSVSTRTVPETRSGRPASPMPGMSVRPPRSSSTSAPAPASRIFVTASGSHTAPTTTSSSPARITASMAVITSWVAPEPQLSAWSRRMTGPSSNARASSSASSMGRWR